MAPLTSSQKAQFAEDGFVVLRGCLREADLRPLEAAYEQRVAEVASRLLAEGRVDSDHAGLPHEKRLAVPTPAFVIQFSFVFVWH